MKTLIQLADDPNTASELVRLLAEDDGDQLPMLSYLIAQTMHGNYFVQSSAMRRNLNLSARDEFDPASLVGALRVLAPKSGYSKEAIWRTAEYYDAQLLAHEIADRIGAPMTRPGAGTPYRLASGAEICRFTGLPNVGRAIGCLSHVRDDNGDPILIRITEKMLCHHFLLGGTTGHGKTNLMANLGVAAYDAEFVPIFYDHKPDYIRIREPSPGSPNGQGVENAQVSRRAA
jgi:hypothetical protein